jgi:23S rRNA (pseudouridine1915-N3)-methyltransferase
MRIRLIWQGKSRNAHLRALEADYVERIGHFVELVVDEIRPTRTSGSTPPGLKGEQMSTAERRTLEKLANSYKVFLDASGREWTSAEFAAWLGEHALRGTRELAFVVGAPEGFSATFKRQADTLLSLSRMTLTREWARALLLEQIYRGFAALRGYPYAK